MIFENKKSPIVSIVVITYNSEKFVIETLESAKTQTYQNIELIISDDCSTDNTVEICSKWLTKNKRMFVRTKLLTVKNNTGISANLNRGCNASNGLFIKLIAGDDILYPNIIDVYVSYFKRNPDVSLVFSQNFLIDSNSNIIGIWEKNIKNSDITFDRQFQGNLVYTPTIFFTKEIFEKVNGFDEALKIEDIDFYLKILGNGGKIHFIKKTLASYRMHGENISSKSELMLLEHIKTLNKYRNYNFNYKYNYRKFSKSILYSCKVKKKIKFFKAYKILSKNNKFLYSIFFDFYFWSKFFLKEPVKKIYKYFTVKRKFI